MRSGNLARVTPKNFAVLLVSSAIFIPLMLVADGPDLGKQLMLGAATALYLVMIVRKGTISAAQVVVVMVIATTGEIVLSLGWGLYDYRFAEIPFYVPPGHGVFYVLAAESARQGFLRRHEETIKRLVIASGSIYALMSLLVAADVWGLIWWVGALLLVTRSRSPLLMSTCIVYTVLLEWLGTAIGNWRWEAVVPFLGLASANPPSGVGILYCLLDLFTVMVCSAGWFAALQGRHAYGSNAVLEVDAVAPIGSALACAVETVPTSRSDFERDRMHRHG